MHPSLTARRHEGSGDDAASRSATRINRRRSRPAPPRLAAVNAFCLATTRARLSNVRMMRMPALIATCVVLLGSAASAAVVSRDARMPRALRWCRAGARVAARANRRRSSRRGRSRRAAIARLSRARARRVAHGGGRARACVRDRSRLPVRWRRRRGWRAWQRDPDVLRVDRSIPSARYAEDERGCTSAPTASRRAAWLASVRRSPSIDTGVEAGSSGHRRGALVHEECFCRAPDSSARTSASSCCPDGRRASVGPRCSARSVDSHGPHVAGIALVTRARGAGGRRAGRAARVGARSRTRTTMDLSPTGCRRWTGSPPNARTCA